MSITQSEHQGDAVSPASEIPVGRSGDVAGELVLAPGLKPGAADDHGSSPSIGESVSYPVTQETFDISKREVVTDRVVIRKTVDDRVTLVEEPVVATTVVVERVPINQVIEEAAQVRQEGNVTIYPVMEEVVTVTKRLVLVEEIHVTRVTATSQYVEEITLRNERIEVDRLGARK